MRAEVTAADLALLYDDDADVVDRSDAIGVIRRAGAFEHEDKIAELLDADQSMLRVEAVLSLVGGWKKEDYLPRGLEMLRNDPKDDARSAAANALYWFLAETGRRRAEILAALAMAVKSDPSEYAARSAYEGLFQLLRPGESTVFLVDPGDRPQYVDWTLVDPYLPN